MAYLNKRLQALGRKGIVTLADGDSGGPAVLEWARHRLTNNQA